MELRIATSDEMRCAVEYEIRERAECASRIYGLSSDNTVVSGESCIEKCFSHGTLRINRGLAVWEGLEVSSCVHSDDLYNRFPCFDYRGQLTSRNRLELAFQAYWLKYDCLVDVFTC